MTATKRHNSEKSPLFRQIRFDQIELDLSIEIESLNNLRHTTLTVPSVLPDSLDLLQYVQPLVLKKKGQTNAKGDAYTLVAGRRTYQIMLEQLPRRSKDKVWALLLPESFPYCAGAIQAFDSIVAKLVLTPNGADRAKIGALLRGDSPIRTTLQTLIDISTDVKIADYLGISKATLYKKTKSLFAQPQPNTQVGQDGTAEIEIDDQSGS